MAKRAASAASSSTGRAERDAIVPFASAYSRGMPGCAPPGWTFVLEEHFARAEVRADLALHALERVVDRLRVALEPVGDRLVAVPVQVERQHRALQLGQDAREARHQAVQLLGGDHLVDRIVRRRTREQLVERRIAVATAGGGRLRE